MYIRTTPTRQTRAIAYRLTRWAGTKPGVTPSPEFPAAGAAGARGATMGEAPMPDGGADT